MKLIQKEKGLVRVFAGGKTFVDIDIEDIEKEKIVNKPSIIVKSRGNIDFEYYDKLFTHKNEMWSYSSKDNNILNIKYLYYYLKKNVDYFKNKAITGKLPQISTTLTDDYKILLPSITIQNRIVEVLDKFQLMVEDVKGLLPEEIEKRAKQYEYYREKLLTFDEICGSGNSTETARKQHGNILNG